MKSVIERLDDIENTARSIVAKAEEDKSQVEQEIQAQRDQFDKELDEKTQAELTRIREDGKRQVPGSISFVPSCAGLLIAGEVIRDLIQKPELK